MAVQTMSVIEDTRKVLQDFLAPELRAIAVRLDALEKKVDGNEQRAETRHKEVMAKIDEVKGYGEIRERLARLEEQNNLK